MSTLVKSTGRPKVKGKLRNFTFREDLDAFLTEESKRTGKDMTMILEQLLARAKNLKQSVRDVELSKFNVKEAA